MKLTLPGSKSSNCSANCIRSSTHQILSRFVNGYNEAEKGAVKPKFKGDHQGIGYGGSVRTIFNQLDAQLKTGQTFDVYAPARNQFRGSGSYGNDGAMRTHPISLFSYGNPGELLKLAEDQAKITHGNDFGYTGAAIQVGSEHLILNSHGHY